MEGYLEARIEEVGDLLDHQVVEQRVEPVQGAVHRHRDVRLVDPVQQRCDPCG